MTTHKFKVGQRVQLAHDAASVVRSYSGRFTVTRQMPESGQGFTYQIKADDETHERVEREAHLEAVF
jgi:hypothetical protein